MTALQALPALLAAESFMLATVALVATLTAPGRSRVSRLPVGPVAVAIVVVLIAAAVGAGTAWADLYVGGSLRSAAEVVIAAALAVVVVVQPFLAGALLLGLRDA